MTADAEHTLELSEKDVINVTEIVMHEYPIDRTSVFLTGHSMGSGGTWYLGAKYSQFWKAIAPMSGPFVDKANYPWDRIRTIPIMMSEGTLATPSLIGSHLMRDWMFDQDFKFEYYEVKANHPGMVRLFCLRSLTSSTVTAANSRLERQTKSAALLSCFVRPVVDEKSGEATQLPKKPKRSFACTSS